MEYCLACHMPLGHVRVGYRAVQLPGHPLAMKGGLVYVHRLVAMRKLGRALGKDEVVHHRNGRRLDNRPRNLEVMTRLEHLRRHPRVLRGSRLR